MTTTDWTTADTPTTTDLRRTVNGPLTLAAASATAADVLGHTTAYTPPPRTKTKVALVGFGPRTRHLAPFGQADWEVWGLNELYADLPPAATADRWFAMHSWAHQQGSTRDPDHWQWLQRCGKPVYMLRPHPDVPTSVAYPLDQAVRTFGAYFTSSPAYMVALAILEGYEELALYGLEMANDEEYAHQRPCVEYLLGWARGRGCTVSIPRGSCVLQAPSLYGYEQHAPGAFDTDALKARITALQTKQGEVQQQLAALAGAKRELEVLARALTAHERGWPVEWIGMQAVPVGPPGSPAPVAPATGPERKRNP